MASGLFLSLDGIDGTGKSTQCRLLADWLRARGWTVAECSDPGGTPLGDVLRDQLLQKKQQLGMATEAFLFMASRAQLVAEIIRPALEKGQAVVCDRFLLANVVYQGHGGGLDIDELWQIGRFATRGLEPDLTLVLDLSIDAALARRPDPPDRIESRDSGFHERVRQGFLAEAKKKPQTIKVIDGNQPAERVHAQIIEEVSRVLAARPRT